MFNEITVKLQCSIEKIKKILDDKGFKIINEYVLDDTYYIPQNINTNLMNIRKILSKAIILRNIDENAPKRNVKKLVFKKKEIASNGDIINQKKFECEIVNIENARSFIESIGYKKIMNIKEYDTIYINNNLEIAVKDVLNGDNLIEIETVQDDEEINNIDKLKEKITELKLPIDTSNYFVKKAEIELEKMKK